MDAFLSAPRTPVTSACCASLTERDLRRYVRRHGGVPEWLKGADCKSAGARLRWFESNPLHHCLRGYDVRDKTRRCEASRVSVQPWRREATWMAGTSPAMT